MYVDVNGCDGLDGCRWMWMDVNENYNGSLYKSTQLYNTGCPTKKNNEKFRMAVILKQIIFE